MWVCSFIQKKIEREEIKIMGQYRYCTTGMTEKERYGDLLERAMKKEEEEQKNMIKAINEVIDFAKQNLETEKERYGNLLEKAVKKEEEKQKKYAEIIASYKTIRI